MKIQNYSVNNNNNAVQYSSAGTGAPSFKAGATALSAVGNFMQGIENQGFWLLFLIQDFLGMTVPRTCTGFLRDKDVTGHYNKQEGFEVLGREGITGPSMMAVAPIGLAAAAVFGRSTSVNSKLIKRLGDNLKEFISKPEFDNDLLKNKKLFKQQFYKHNLEKILTDSLGKENFTENDITYILGEISKYEDIPSEAKLKRFMGKSKYRDERIANILNYIDNIRYNTSSDLNKLQSVTVNGADFSIRNTIDGMLKYSSDAISTNKKFGQLDEAMAENIKNNSIAKRFITNAALLASTFGVLKLLPKLYAKGKVPPGAKTVEFMRQQQTNNTMKSGAAQSADEKSSENKGEVSFKGKGKPAGNSSLFSKMGQFISENFSDKYASEFEYNGHNFTPTLMACLSVFGLFATRGWHAYKRAPKDEQTGKKDYTEIWEIAIRDVISSLGVVFVVPMGTRACVTSYENHSGFVLMHKDRTKNKLQTTLDLFNPYSKAHVMTNSEIESLYNNIDSKAKMLNFCEYIDKNDGDLQKILSKSENVKEVFDKNSFDLEGITNLSKKEKNKKIMDYIKDFNKNNMNEADEQIKKLMKGAGDKHGNKIAAFARGFNSIPGLITMFCISPFILGWLVPRLTYLNTRRLHAKAEKEREQKKINTAA